MSGKEILDNGTWDVSSDASAQGAPSQGEPVQGAPSQGEPAQGAPPQGAPYMQTAAAPSAKASSQPLYAVSPGNPGLKKKETEHTKRMKENFRFFGPVTFLYALFYAFCMFRNGSGVTFPFFMAGSLLYLCFALSKLEISLKKGSIFYMISMMLLAVSTFCTDDGRIIAFNKTGIFLLMMSLLLKQFFETAEWKLGKYLLAICELVFVSLGEIYRPFSDAAAYRRQRGKRTNGKFGYVALGLLIALPLVGMVLELLSSADAVFRDLTDRFWQNVNIGNIYNVCFRVVFLFFAAYMLLAYLCKHTINEKVKDCRTNEPVLAITINSLLTIIYLLFSVIQIVYLFLGKMQLPEGYTYAAYAREGFFQLLAVSVLNLIIVLVSMCCFRENALLKAILTVMSLCTFVMIASSALRMIIYIRFYYLTFLRILVLWGLALLFVLFVGVIISIYGNKFPLFRYSMVVVTLLYLVLSFAHPDYIIAAVNVANAPVNLSVDVDGVINEDPTGFFLAEDPYQDYSYLANLSADAAPVLIPYLERLGYDMESFYIRSENWGDLSMSEQTRCIAPIIERRAVRKTAEDGFGYYYLRKLQLSTDGFGIRTYNVSRHMALWQIEKACHRDAR